MQTNQPCQRPGDSFTTGLQGGKDMSGKSVPLDLQCGDGLPAFQENGGQQKSKGGRFFREYGFIRIQRKKQPVSR